VQNNISKSIYEKDSAYVPSNISSDENFIQSAIDQATNIIAEQTNSATNISSRLDISTLRNVSEEDTQDENINEG